MVVIPLCPVLISVLHIVARSCVTNEKERVFGIVLEHVSHRQKCIFNPLLCRSRTPEKDVTSKETVYKTVLRKKHNYLLIL